MRRARVRVRPPSHDGGWGHHSKLGRPVNRHVHDRRRKARDTWVLGTRLCYTSRRRGARCRTAAVSAAGGGACAAECLLRGPDLQGSCVPKTKTTRHVALLRAAMPSFFRRCKRRAWGTDVRPVRLRQRAVLGVLYISSSLHGSGPAFYFSLILEVFKV